MNTNTNNTNMNESGIHLHQQLLWKSESSDDYVSHEHLFYDINTQTCLLFTGTPAHTCYYTHRNVRRSENVTKDNEDDNENMDVPHVDVDVDDTYVYEWKPFPLDLSSCNTVEWKLLSCNITYDHRYISLGISDKEIKVIECSTGKVVAARAVKANHICVMLGSYWLTKNIYTVDQGGNKVTHVQENNDTYDMGQHHILFVTSLGCEQYRLIKSPPLLSTASAAKISSTSLSTAPPPLQHRLLHIKTIPLSGVTMHWMLCNTLVLMNEHQHFFIYQLSTHYHSSTASAATNSANVNVTGAAAQHPSNTKKKDYIQLTLPFKVTKQRNIHIVQLYNNDHPSDDKHKQSTTRSTPQGSNTPFLCAIDEIDSILRIYSFNWTSMTATELFTYPLPQQAVDREQIQRKLQLSLLDNVIVVHDTLSHSATLIDTHTDSNRVLLTDVKMSYISSKHTQQHTAALSLSPSAITTNDDGTPINKHERALETGYRRIYNAYGDAKFLYPSMMWQTLGEQYHGRLFTLSLNYDVCSSLIATHLSPPSALSFLLKRTHHANIVKTVCLRLIRNTVEKLLRSENENESSGDDNQSDNTNLTIIHQMFAAVNLVWSDVADKSVCTATPILSNSQLREMLGSDAMQYTHELIAEHMTLSAAPTSSVQSAEHFNQHLLINEYDIFLHVFAPCNIYLTTGRNMSHMISIVLEYIQSLVKHSLPVSTLLSSYTTSLLIQHKEFQTVRLFYHANIIPPSVIAATQMLEYIGKNSNDPSICTSSILLLVEDTALHMLRTFIDQPSEHPTSHVYAAKLQYYTYMLHHKHSHPQHYPNIIELLRELKSDESLFREERLKPVEWLNMEYSMCEKQNEKDKKNVDSSELMFYWCYIYFQRQAPHAVSDFEERFHSLFPEKSTSSSSSFINNTSTDYQG